MLPMSQGMFVHTEETLVLSQACLQSLCASLNAPVVNIEELPVAPARAALVIYAEDYGDLALAVAIRSAQNGQVALFRYRGRVATTAPDGQPVEDALSFAEGLGFLFDDDMLADGSDRSREAAFEHWNLLVGAESAQQDGFAMVEESEVDPPDDDILPSVQELLEPAEELLPAEEAAPALGLDQASVIEPELELIRNSDPAAGGGDDLLLDDLMDLDGEPDLPLEMDEGEPGDDPMPLEDLAGSTIELTGAPPELAVPPAEQAAAVEPAPVEEPAASGAVPLTKFRRAGDANEAAAGGGSQLGRIPIVRRKQGDPSKPSYLGRLLASF